MIDVHRMRTATSVLIYSKQKYYETENLRMNETIILSELKLSYAW